MLLLFGLNRVKHSLFVHDAEMCDLKYEGLQDFSVFYINMSKMHVC